MKTIKTIALAIVLITCSTCISAQCPFTTTFIPAGIKQDQSMNCWAAAITMMYEWKQRAKLEMKDVIKTLGDPFNSIFVKNEGLSADEKKELLTKTGIKAEGPASYPPKAWCKMLKDHGALWVTTDENPNGEDFYIHARILYGIIGDGTPNNTSMLFIDPATGKTVTEKFMDFIPKYEAELKKVYKQRYNQEWPDNFEIRIQILHW